MVSLVFSALLAVLESVSLVLLYALVDAASTKGIPTGRVADIAGWFNLNTRRSLLTAMGVTLCVVYISKTTFGLLLRKWTIKILLEADTAVQTRFFSEYLNAPLSFHLANNSATFVRNITRTLSDAVGSGLSTVSQVVSDGLVLIAVFATALLVEPVGALVAAAYFTALGLVIYKVIRRRHLAASKQYMRGAQATLAATNQAFGAIREIAVAGKGDAFSRLLSAGRADIVESQATTMFFGELPRFVLELGVVLAAAPIIVIVQSNDSNSSAAAIALFAAVAFRAMPTVSRLLSGFASAVYTRVAATAMLDAEREVTAAIEADSVPTLNDDGPQLHFNDSIVFDNVSFRYGGHIENTLVLEHISLTIHRGEYIGLIGESGSGKSTLLDLMVGLQRPTSGVVSVDGVDIAHARDAWRDLIGYVPQHVYILDRSVLENVAFGELGADGIDRDRVWEALEAAHLGDVIRSLPNGIETALGERGTRLSGGQQQRIGIARALYRRPKLLILDEATSALDTATEREILSAIDQLSGSVAIVAVTHRLASLDHCDRILGISAGRLSELHSRRIDPAP